MDWVPGPKYSMMALVPPDTVSSPGEAQDDVLGGGPAAQVAGQVYADPPGIEKLPGQAGHDFDGVGPAYPYGAGAESPALGVWESVPMIMAPGKAYCSSTTWWMMPEPGPQKPTPNLAAAVLRKS